MQRENRLSGRLGYWMVSLLLVSVIPAAADVTVRGNVQVWNFVTNAYEPLKQARVRVVLAEYHDCDTRDVEAQTDNSGNYSVKKGNAWVRDGYDAYLIAFAEVEDKLEVQSHYMQVDGYQAVSGTVFARDNRTTTINLKIGGPQDNVRKYQVGGVAALGNASSVNNRTQGHRAFFIFHEMTDHRLQLAARSLGEGDFEEKEVSYPVDADVGSYVPVLDYIRFPDRHFTEGYDRASEVCRHELSHGIMADTYIAWPGWMHLWTYPREHELAMEWKDRDFAWSEAWADFLSQVTQSLRYGRPHIDLESLDASWRRQIKAGADHSKIEGEIAGALWDIYDGVGWEKRYEQVGAIPGEEQFYDGIADPDLTKIWHIFKTFHPYGFTHVSYMGKPDNFVWYWLNKTPYGQRHALKAILFNRGIRTDELPQNPPSVNITSALWRGDQAVISVEVREQDNEDREHVWLEIYLNGTRIDRVRLSSGWSGDRRNWTFAIYGIEWKEGQPYPTILVAAHDDMQSGYVQQTLTPSTGPEPQRVIAWSVELLGISVRNFRLGFPLPELRDLVLNVQVSDGHSTRNIRFPSSGSWQVGAMREFRYSQTTELLRTSTATIWDFVELNFTLQGRSDSRNLNGNLQKRYMRYNGIGTHAEIIPVNLPGIQVEVIYRIKAITESERKELIALTVSQFFPSAYEAVKLVRPETVAKSPQPAAPGTPTAVLARVSRLIDEYARLQATTLEIADELEWKLSPERLPQLGTEEPKEKTPQKLLPQTLRTAPRLLKPELLTSSGLLQLPPTQFLDKAVQGQGLVVKLPTTTQVNLRGLKDEVEGAMERIPQIRNEAEQLQTQINQAISQINAMPNLDNKAKQMATQRLVGASERLAHIGTSTEGFLSVLRKELQVIQRFLLPTK